MQVPRWDQGGAAIGWTRHRGGRPGEGGGPWRRGGGVCRVDKSLFGAGRARCRGAGGEGPSVGGGGCPSAHCRIRIDDRRALPALSRILRESGRGLCASAGPIPARDTVGLRSPHVEEEVDAEEVGQASSRPPQAKCPWLVHEKQPLAPRNAPRRRGCRPRVCRREQRAGRPSHRRPRSPLLPGACAAGRTVDRPRHPRSGDRGAGGHEPHRPARAHRRHRHLAGRWGLPRGLPAPHTATAARRCTSASRSSSSTSPAPAR